MVALPLSTQLIGTDRAVWDDRGQGIVEVRDHLARLQAEYPVDPDRIVLGGFSMGGQLAAWMAVSGVVKVRGFYVVAPYISDLEEWNGLIENAASHDLRVGFLLGAEDTVSGKTPEELAQRLRAAGVPCELDIIPGLRHAYPPDFASRLARMLDYICQA
jgi:acetyl esterase/lipase